MTTAKRWTIFAVVCLSCAGCGAPGLSQRLKDSDPAVRSAAAVEAGQLHDASAVPPLVDCLEDEETDVRFFAILALKRITGDTMGYKYYAPRAERAAAVQRWREWVADQVGAGRQVAGQPPAPAEADKPL